MGVSCFWPPQSNSGHWYMGRSRGQLQGWKKTTHDMLLDVMLEWNFNKTHQIPLGPAVVPWLIHPYGSTKYPQKTLSCSRRSNQIFLNIGGDIPSQIVRNFRSRFRCFILLNHYICRSFSGPWQCCLLRFTSFSLKGGTFTWHDPGVLLRLWNWHNLT